MKRDRSWLWLPLVKGSWYLSACVVKLTGHVQNGRFHQLYACDDLDLVVMCSFSYQALVLWAFSQAFHLSRYQRAVAWGISPQESGSEQADD